MELQDITMDTVSKELIQTNFGIKVLSASNKTENVEYAAATPQLELVLGYLSSLANHDRFGYRHQLPSGFQCHPG